MFLLELGKLSIQKAFLALVVCTPLLVSLQLVVFYEALNFHKEQPGFFELVVFRSFALSRELSDPYSYDSRLQTGLALYETLVKDDSRGLPKKKHNATKSSGKKLYNVITEVDYCERNFMNLWSTPALIDVNTVMATGDWEEIPYEAASSFGIHTHPRLTLKRDKKVTSQSRPKMRLEELK